MKIRFLLICQRQRKLRDTNDMKFALQNRHSKNSSTHIPPFPANTLHQTNILSPTLAAGESLCDVGCM